MAPRKFTRRAQVATLLRKLAADAKGGVAALAEVVAANAEMRTRAFDYGTGKPMQAKITKAAKDKKLDLTVIMSVSGHTGQAARFAKSNRYVIRVTFPDGSTKTMRGIRAKGAYSTAQDITIPLEKGKTTVDAWPEGSAGVGGYIEGRRTIITY